METIDLYNKNKEKIGKTFVRHQDILLDDEYYLLETGWIVNKKNEILLTRRSLNKSHAGMWEATAGHVKAGETDLEGIQRELKEETGLEIKKEDFIFIKSYIKKNAIHDVWLTKGDYTIDDIKIDKDEVIDAKFVTFDEFNSMLKNGEIIESLSYFVDIYPNFIS